MTGEAADRKSAAPAIWLAGAAAALVALTLVSSFLMSLEYDEAWIIASALRMFDAEALPAAAPTTPTGGVYGLVVGLLGAPGAPAVLVARGLAFASLATLVALCAFSVPAGAERATRRWLVGLSCLAAPGGVFMGSMGYGIAPATLFAAAALTVWAQGDPPRPGRAAAAGLLLGVAIATRLTFLPLVPVFAMLSLLHFREQAARPKALRAAAIATGAALMVAVVSAWIVSRTVSAAAMTHSVVESTGLFWGLPELNRITGFLAKLAVMAPGPLVVFLAIAAWPPWRRMADPTGRLIVACAAAAALIAAAWILRAPFLHTRYIWPAALFVCWGGGLALAALYGAAREMRPESRRVVRALCLSIPLGVALAGLLLSVRLVAAGAAMQTNTAGFGEFELHFKPLALKREQRAAAEYLARRLGPEDVAVAIALPAGLSEMQLGLLSQRRIVDIEDLPEGAPPPALIVTHRLGQLSQEGLRWLEGVSSREGEAGGYVFRRPTERLSRPPEGAYIPPQLYRFTLPRALSWSG